MGAVQTTVILSTCHPVRVRPPHGLATPRRLHDGSATIAPLRRARHISHKRAAHSRACVRTTGERPDVSSRWAAHAAAHRADRAQSAPHFSARHRRARRRARRQARAVVRPRNPELPRACRTVPPLPALGAAAGDRQGRRGRPADAEPAGISRDLARAHPRRRDRRAAQHQFVRHRARLLHRHRRERGT